MTVGELRQKLYRYREDIKIILENNNAYKDGPYEAKSTISCDDEAVMIETDYGKRYEP